VAEGDGIKMNLEALMAPYGGRSMDVTEAEGQAPRHRAAGLFALERDSYEGCAAPRHCADARDEVESAVITYGALPRHRADTLLRVV